MAHVLCHQKASFKLCRATADVNTDIESQVLMDFKRGVTALSGTSTCRQPLPLPTVSSVVYFARVLTVSCVKGGPIAILAGHCLH